MEQPLEAISKKLWPWSESKLILFVIILAALDYSSTYACLTFGKNPQVMEGGLISWLGSANGWLPEIALSGRGLRSVLLY